MITTTTNSPTITISGSLGSTGSYVISGSSSTSYALGMTGISMVGYHSVQPSTVKYHVLGQDIEVSGSYLDAVTALYVSMINVAGKPFYDEVKKQNVKFPKEIEEYLKKAIISWDRGKKIDTIFNDEGTI